MTNKNARMPWSFEAKACTELISASRATLSNFVAADLALGLTYCTTANLTNSPEKRHHLLTLARETLTTAEMCMELAPPETFTGVLEDADRLRSAIAQLERNSEFRISSCSSPLLTRTDS